MPLINFTLIPASPSPYLFLLICLLFASLPYRFSSTPTFPFFLSFFIFNFTPAPSQLHINSPLSFGIDFFLFLLTLSRPYSFLPLIKKENKMEGKSKF